MELGRELSARDYAFTTVTPETHWRVLSRAARIGRGQAASLRDVFGHNLPFEASRLPASLLDSMRAADVVEDCQGLLRASIRFSTLHGRIFLHSGFPTTAPDSVFFGPDTYRFAALLKRWTTRHRRAIDVGCGSGAGGLSIAGRVDELWLGDVNPRALSYSRVNATLAGVSAECVLSDVLQDAPGPFDLIIANPPYLVDADKRLYRDGGGRFGEGLALRIVREGLQRLAPQGVLIVYTGSAIVEGRDTFGEQLAPLSADRSLRVDYEELDPDVFGEELDHPAYEQVERLAVVAARITRR